MKIMIQSVSTCNSCDCAIIGGGILGLWYARHAVRRGENVILIEKQDIGAGASGGFLGALMPHMPDNWNAKKQFQYDGLHSIEKAISELEEDTGLDCGFRRCGRIMPLTHDRLMPQVERRLSGAVANWGSNYEMRIDDAQDHAFWLNADIAAFGVQADDFSARVNPRRYVLALASYLKSRAHVIEGVAADIASTSANGGVLNLSSGDRVLADRIVVANGWEAYPMLQPFMGHMNRGKPIGRGVKGQAVLVEYEHSDDLPIVYHDGCYVVPHAGGYVAIGSTSLNEWIGQPNAFDDADMDFYRKAISLVPSLASAPIVARWAGVRPRNTIDGRGTSPWFGPVPGVEGLFALIGGFKITLGIAHLDSLIAH